MATTVFKRASRGKSKEEILQEIEDRLKLDRGGFSTFVEDTGSEGGYIVPGTITRSQFSPLESRDITPSFRAQSPSYPDIPQNQPAQQQNDNRTDINSAEGFFRAVAEAKYAPTQRSEQEAASILQDRLEERGEAYPVARTVSGDYQYSDGTIRPKAAYEQQLAVEGISTKNAKPIQSLPDGNVLWSDGFVRAGMPTSTAQELSGVEGISQGLFGQQQTITQPYGNYNPNFGYSANTHRGTDFRTRDLENRNIRNLFNIPLEVVESYGQASPGSGRPENFENRGYGNSLLLRFPDGTMIRVSHLDQNDWKVGDVIQPGEALGIAGNTGNSSAEHADVEVISADNQIISPDQFLAKVMSESQSNEPLYKMENGRAVGLQSYAPIADQQNQSFQNPQGSTPQTSLLEDARQSRASGSNILSVLSDIPARETIDSIVETSQTEPVQQAARMAGEQIGKVVDVANPTGSFDVGITEGLITPEASEARIESVKKSQPSRGLFGKVRQSAGNLTEAIGDTLGVPESNFSELLAGGKTRRTNLATASSIDAAQGQTPGESLGVRDSLSKAAQNAGDGIRGLFSRRNDQENQLDQVLENREDANKYQSGAGISQLRGGQSYDGGTGADLMSKASPQQMQSLSDMRDDRVVGRSAGANILNTAPTVDRAQSLARRDTSDPFFRSPVFESVRGNTQFANQEVPRDQALSQDIFNESFYSDPGQVDQVFGQTYMRDSALQKATDQFKDRYRRAYSGGEYDQGDVERILSQLPSDLNYSPNLREPRKIERKRYSLQDYLRMGKTPAQYYAETGQQSVADSAGGSDKAFRNYQQAQENSRRQAEARRNPHSQYNPYNHRGKKMSVGPRQGVRNSINAAARGYQYVSPSGNVVKNYSDQNSNMSDASTGLGVVGHNPAPEKKKSDNNMFSRARSFSGGIFKRFFN